MTPLPLRDIDSARRARWIQAFGWAAFPGLFIGVAAAVPLSAYIGGMAFVLMPLLFTVVVGAFALALGEGMGGVVAAVAHPRGAPLARDYSHVDAMLLRGEPEKAADLLRAEADRAPDDPEPRLRLARLYRDEVERPREAAAWFRAARDTPGLAPARSAIVSRELAELLRAVDDLAGALTELARLAELHPDTPAGRWAEAERAHLKTVWLGRSEG
ncbi:hypothetical protein V3331_13505 [Gaopeijia maritima]|uniref:tetratricopeptide repeat protein n=1 Tax=Gaopeijia maritima TaxID=3119007 RepID=UPI00324BC382